MLHLSNVIDSCFQILIYSWDVGISDTVLNRSRSAI